MPKPDAVSAAGSPDDAPAVKKSNGRPRLEEPNSREQITLRMAKDDLVKIDAAAAERRISRASFIRQAIFEFMK